MIQALDSAQPPALEQAQAALAAGVGKWFGYLSTQPGLGLLRPWTEAEFGIVQQVFGGRPVGFCSGLDDPAAVRALAASWDVVPCLDVEPEIRPDGPWVQDWLDASGAGLYGACSIHGGRSAAFHVLAWYPVSPPASTWYDGFCARPAGPVGWQQQGSHPEFGVDVDRGLYDDWFGGLMLSDDDLNAIADRVASRFFGTTPPATYLTDIAQETVNGVPRGTNGVATQLPAILAAIKAIPVAGGLTAAQATLLQEAHDAILRIEKADQGA